MKSSGTYLLEKICQHETNGFSSMGEFNAKHFNDVSAIMKAFAEETILEFVDRINKGEDIYVADRVISFKKRKAKSRREL